VTAVASRILDAPSARAWTRRVAYALALGETVFAVFPETIDASKVIDDVAVAVDGRGCTVKEIDLAVCALLRPLAALAGEIGISATAATTPEMFVAHPEVPPVIRLSGFGALSEGEAVQWVATIERIARASSKRPGQGAAILCHVAGHTHIGVLPSPASHLQLHWWVGIPSATELLLTCRDEREYTHAARQSWREHVLSSLAGNDPLLADALWEIVFESDEAIGRALRGYAARRGWNSAQLTKHGANEIVPSPLAGRNREPPRQRELWAMGAVVQTEEFGLELHSAALAALERDAEWVHRLWRGQAALVLPVLEDLRLRVCQRLSDVWGTNWPFRWERPQSEEEYKEVKDDPLAASWGFLAHLHRVALNLSRDAAMGALVNRARYIRNELSHNRPIRFPDYRVLHDRAGDLLWPK